MRDTREWTPSGSPGRARASPRVTTPPKGIAT